MIPYWSLYKFPFCLLHYFKVSVQFLLLYSWTWAQDQNSDAVYYDAVKTRNLVIRFSRQDSSVETQGNFSKIEAKEISLKLDYFHGKSYHIIINSVSFHLASCHIFIINFFSILYFSVVTAGLRMYVWLAIKMHLIM